MMRHACCVALNATPPQPPHPNHASNICACVLQLLASNSKLASALKFLDMFPGELQGGGGANPLSL
jgi:hypothetical protein